MAGGPAARVPGGVHRVLLLPRAVARHGPPTWLVSDRDRAFRDGRVSEFLQRHAIGRRYGAVGRKSSIALIERFWRSMKTEYVNGLFLYRSQVAIETRLRRYARWYNRERPHWGLANRTPAEVHCQQPERVPRRLTMGTLSVRFLHGDRRLPILRLARAA